MRKEAKLIDATSAEAADIQQIESWLQMWHIRGQQSHVRGYNSRALVCGDYLISRQHDDANGALDERLDKLNVLALDSCIAKLPDPQRSAVHLHARNLCTRVKVWSGPKMPANPLDAAELVHNALQMLRRLLQRAGVL